MLRVYQTVCRKFGQVQIDKTLQNIQFSSTSTILIPQRMPQTHNQVKNMVSYFEKIPLKYLIISIHCMLPTVPWSIDGRRCGIFNNNIDGDSVQAYFLQDRGRRGFGQVCKRQIVRRRSLFDLEVRQFYNEINISTVLRVLVTNMF